MPDHCPESGTENACEYECLYGQNNFITSTIFVVFFAYLSSNTSTSFALKAILLSRRGWERFVTDYDV